MFLVSIGLPRCLDLAPYQSPAASVACRIKGTRMCAGKEAGIMASLDVKLLCQVKVAKTQPQHNNMCHNLPQVWDMPGAGLRDSFRKQ